MDEAMMDAMKLEGGGDQAFQDDPGAPIVLTDQSGEAVEMDPEAIAAEGLGYAYRDMAKNGPIRPTHIGRARTMTKAQLATQKANEAEGLPSNLDEAQRVKDLEGKVASIETGVCNILELLNGQSSPASTPPSVPTGGTPVRQDGSPILINPSVTVPPPNPTSTVSSESTEPVNKQPKLRQVTLKDGRKISVPQHSPPAMNLGPVAEAPDALPPEQYEFSNHAVPVQEPPNPALWQEPGVPPDDWDDPVVAVAKTDVVDAVPDPKLVRIQQLVQDVNDFMRANDVHRFWRRHLSQKVHRHIGYNGWPKVMQMEFDKRFKGFLSDPQFVTSVCRKVMDMEMGHALGAKWVAGFLVVTAGFTAWALCGLDS